MITYKLLCIFVAISILGCVNAPVAISPPKFPPMPTKEERPVVREVARIHCENVQTSLLQRASVEATDRSRVFYVFFRTIPVKPYKTVDLVIAEYDPTTAQFIQAWIDHDGDEKADEYFDTFEKLTNKYPSMCHVIQ